MPIAVFGLTREADAGSNKTSWDVWKALSNTLVKVEGSLSKWIKKKYTLTSGNILSNTQLANIESPFSSFQHSWLNSSSAKHHITSHHTTPHHTPSHSQATERERVWLTIIFQLLVKAQTMQKSFPTPSIIIILKKKKMKQAKGTSRSTNGGVIDRCQILYL